MNAVIKFCTKVLNLVLFILVCAIVILISIQILSRYILHDPTTWTEETVRYCFIWLVMLGAVKGMQERRHLCLDLFTDKMSPKVRTVYQIFMSAVIIAFFIVIANAGINILPVVSMQLSPTLQISMAIPYSAILLGFAVMALQQLIIIINCILALKNGEEVII